VGRVCRCYERRCSTLVCFYDRIIGRRHFLVSSTTVDKKAAVLVYQCFTKIKRNTYTAVFVCSLETEPYRVLQMSRHLTFHKVV